MSSTAATALDPADAGKIDTTALMALAAILIVNSHLEDFYRHARFLAADGLIGNSLFFMLSGFGLQLSQQRSPRPFLSYCARRAVRIYPAVFLAVFFFAVILQGRASYWSLNDYRRNFLWPTTFSYVRLIIPFYLIFYFILKAGSPRVYATLLLLCTLPYLAFYLPDAQRIPSNFHLALGARPFWIHSTAYFQVMLLGGWLASTRLTRRPALAWLALIAVTVLIVYLALKFRMVVLGRGAAYYGVLHLLVLIECGALCFLFTSPRFAKAWRARPMTARPIILIGSLTLEIYLIHSFLIEFPWLPSLPLPLNFIVLIVLTLACAWLLAWIIAKAGSGLAPAMRGVSRAFRPVSR